MHVPSPREARVPPRPRPGVTHLPSRPKRGRHRAPRQPVPTRALAVPVVLLATGGGAFAGLAGVPGVTGTSVVQTASAAGVPTTVALPRETYAKDLDALDESAARAQVAQVAQQRARAAAAERATRSRRAALDAQAKKRASTLAAAAVEKAAIAETERKARLQRHVRPAVERRAHVPLRTPLGPPARRPRLRGRHGSPIRSVAAGEVVDAGYNSGYGNYVHVQHADGTVTTYNHMSRILRRGGSVDPGDVLGLVGSTGHSTGPHLHFEVRVDGQPIDPLPWLRRHGVGV